MENFEEQTADNEIGTIKKFRIFLIANVAEPRAGGLEICHLSPGFITSTPERAERIQGCKQ